MPQRGREVLLYRAFRDIETGGNLPVIKAGNPVEHEYAARQSRQLIQDGSKLADLLPCCRHLLGPGLVVGDVGEVVMRDARGAPPA